jgi:hypothetical protein
MDRLLKSIALGVVGLMLLYWGLSPRNGVNRDFVRAIAAWHAHPSTETQAEVDRQRRIKQMRDWGNGFVFFGGLVTVAFFTVRTWWPNRTPMTPARSDQGGATG